MNVNVKDAMQEVAQKATQWCRDWNNWVEVLQNPITARILAAFTLIGIMIWSYLHGLSGPWIAITGVAAMSAILWLRREFVAHSVKPATVLFVQNTDELITMRNTINHLKTELHSAKEAANRWEKSYNTTQQALAESAGKPASRRERLDDIKAVLRDQIEAAPKTFEVDDASAWVTATDDLLDKLKLRTTHCQVEKNYGMEKCKKEFQSALAHVRALVASLSEKDIAA